MIIIDEFLPASLDNKIYNFITNSNFLWNYRENMVSETCTFDTNKYKDYYYLGKNFIDSPYLNAIINFSEFHTKIIATKVLRSKVNFHFINSDTREHPPHIDSSIPGTYSILYYVNTTNSYTRFLNTNTIVEHRRNRAVIFDSNILHCGSNSTDKPRIAINTIIATK